VTVIVNSDAIAGWPCPYWFLHCDWLQPHKKWTCLYLVAVTSQLHHCCCHNCEHEITQCCMASHCCRNHITVVTWTMLYWVELYYIHSCPVCGILVRNLLCWTHDSDIMVWLLQCISTPILKHCASLKQTSKYFKYAKFQLIVCSQTQFYPSCPTPLFTLIRVHFAPANPTCD